LTDVTKSRWPFVALLGGVAFLACGGSTSVESTSVAGGGSGDASTFGVQYQGDGVQCGALVCSGTQQCCLVYIAADADNSNPTHACDQDCQSVCADVCPDAGGQTSAMMLGGGPMGGMGGPAGMGDAMVGTGGMGGPMGGMGDPMGGMGHPTGGAGDAGSGNAGDGGPAGPGAPPDSGGP
jgi:hypothetical protein